MATLRENLGYIPVRLGAELAKRREEMAMLMERAVRERIAAGEGLGTYSTTPTWFNVTRIPFARPRFDRYRAMVQPRRRSRYGYASIWLEQGYAEYRGVVKGTGTQTAPVNLELTGALMANLRGRAQPAADGGLHAWLGFRRQQRSYGRLTNRELADAMNERYSTLKPFQLTEGEADSIFNEIITPALVSSGAQ